MGTLKAILEAFNAIARGLDRLAASNEALANRENLEIRQEQRTLELRINSVQTDEQRALLARHLSDIERRIRK